MHAHWPEWTICRKVIAVAALYALVLQSIFGSAIPIEPPGPLGMLCLQNAEGSADVPTEAPSAHGHLTCCTAAKVAPSIPVPILASTDIVWPIPHRGHVVLRPEIVAAPRAPPGVRPSARAPPVI